MGLWKRIVEFDTTLRILWEYTKGLAFVVAGAGLTAWTAVSDNPAWWWWVPGPGCAAIGVVLILGTYTVHRKHRRAVQRERLKEQQQLFRARPMPDESDSGSSS